MVYIDKYYKIIASTFGIAYFVGLIIALIITRRADLVLEINVAFMENLFLTNTLNFKLTMQEIFYNSINLFAMPFSYLVASVQYGFLHVSLLNSSFLGQVKLLVQIIPQFMFFIAYIIFSTLGIKVLFQIVKLFINKFIIKENEYKIKEKIFKKSDIYLLYIALITIVIASAINTYLTRVLFLFFINLKALAYVILVIIYIILFILCVYMIYKTIDDYLKKYNIKKKQI